MGKGFLIVLLVLIVAIVGIGYYSYISTNVTNAYFTNIGSDLADTNGRYFSQEENQKYSARFVNPETDQLDYVRYINPDYYNKLDNNETLANTTYITYGFDGNIYSFNCEVSGSCSNIVYSGYDISLLNNDVGYITSADVNLDLYVPFVDADKNLDLGLFDLLAKTVYSYINNGAFGSGKVTLTNFDYGSGLLSYPEIIGEIISNIPLVFPSLNVIFFRDNAYIRDQDEDGYVSLGLTDSFVDSNHIKSANYRYNVVEEQVYWDGNVVQGNFNYPVYFDKNVTATDGVFSGNVGIRTTSPAYPLDVNGSTHIGTGSGVTATGTLYLGDGDIGKAYGGGFIFSSGISASGNILGTRLGFSSAPFSRFTNPTSNNIGIEISGKGEVVTINDNGNVGIGTTSPSEKLEVNGNLFLNGDNDKILLGTGKDASITYDGTNLIINPQEVGNGLVYIDGNIILTSPDSTEWNCGVSNSGVFSCS